MEDVPLRTICFAVYYHLGLWDMTGRGLHQEQTDRLSQAGLHCALVWIDFHQSMLMFRNSISVFRLMYRYTDEPLISFKLQTELRRPNAPLDRQINL